MRTDRVADFAKPLPATEADTLEALAVKLETMIPELLDANDGGEMGDVPFELLARRFAVAQRAA